MGQTTFGKAFGNYRDTVARFYAETSKAESDSLYSGDGVSTGNAYPIVADLIGKRVGFIVASKRLQAKMRDRLRNVLKSDQVRGCHQSRLVKNVKILKLLQLLIFAN